MTAEDEGDVLDRILGRLGPGARRVLAHHNIQTIAELYELTYEQITSMPGTGLVTWNSIQDCLYEELEAYEYGFGSQIAGLHDVTWGCTSEPVSEKLERFPFYCGSAYAAKGTVPDHFCRDISIDVLDLTSDQAKTLKLHGICDIGDLLCTHAEEILLFEGASENLLSLLQDRLRGLVEYQMTFGSLNSPTLEDFPLFGRLPFFPQSEVPNCYFPDVAITKLDLHQPYCEALMTKGISKLRDLLCVRQDKIPQAIPIAGLQFKVRTYLDQRQYAQELIRSSKTISDLLSKLCRQIHFNKTHTSVVLYLFGARDGLPKTLQQTGDRYALTRERVRQIKVKMQEQFKSLPLMVSVADSLADSIHEILRSWGGLMGFKELATQLNHVSYWPPLPGWKMLAMFCKTLDLSGFEQTPNQIGVSHPCRQCLDVVNNTRIMMKQNFAGIQLNRITPDRLCGTIRNCNGYTCKAFSYQFVEELAERAGGCCTQGRLYPTKQTITALVEYVLKESDSPLHFSEVASELARATRQAVPDASVHNILGNASYALHWERGTYIHRSKVVISSDLIKDVHAWVLQKLNQDIPYLSVNAAFQHFERECQESGIPSESALYTCLREMPHATLLCPRYPYICRRRRGGEQEHIPIAVHLEEWLQEQGEPVTEQRMRDYVCNQIGLKDFQYGLLIYALRNTVRTENGGFVHLSVLNISKKQIIPLVDYAVDLAGRSGHVSANKIYEDKAVTCHLLGIQGPKMLHSVLNTFAEDRLKFPGYMRITLPNRDEEDKANTILHEVASFIKNRPRPCSYEEIGEHFVEGLGYRSATIRMAVERNDVFRYLRGCVIHKNTINWDAEKQARLEVIAKQLFERELEAGHFFARCSDLLEAHENELPALANNLVWTPTLLADILGNSDTITILGNALNAYVSQPNRLDIHTFEDLVWQILDQKFNGATNLDILSEFLRDQRVVQRTVTSSMLRGQERVIVLGHEILLKELA
jgi:hypothetical protein